VIPTRPCYLTTALAGLTWLGIVASLAVAVPAGNAAAVVFCVATALLWISGLRSAALWLRAAALRRRREPSQGPLSAAREVEWRREANSRLRVALLYCVADDVDLAAISASMGQDVAVDTVILDDSTRPATRARIDAFAQRNGCRVVRRPDRVGFKAGNLNHGLAALRGQFDAFAICDSDVVLPSDFVRRCSGALVDPAVAVAQGHPDAAGGHTWFARYFGPLLGTHIGVTRHGREAHGVVAFLGRGAVVRASAIDQVGGFPVAVAEDLAFTMALRSHGWRLANVDIAFHEDYPVDYRSFRTQVRKTAEGAVEFLRRPGRVRGLPLQEKIDVLSEVALVPVTALAGVGALISGSALAAHGTPPPAWALLVTALSALAPLLPEGVARARRQRLAAGVLFVALGGALYASSMFVVLGAVLRTLLGGRAVFWITPKTAQQLGVRQVFAQLRPELVIAPPLMLVTAVVSGMPLSAAGLVWPLAVSVAFLLPALRAGGRDAVAPGFDRSRRRRRVRPAAGEGARRPGLVTGDRAGAGVGARA
jgi:hypothetical protein